MKRTIAVLEMTDERKERMKRASGEILKILEQHVPDLVETFTVLDMVKRSYEEAHQVQCHSAQPVSTKDLKGYGEA